MQNVPAGAGSEELDEIVHWLGTLVRQVDSSLIDEWERLQHPEDDVAAVRPGIPSDDDVVTITSDARAFRTMVRNEAFRWVEHVARRKRPRNAADGLDVATAMAPYWERYDSIDIGGDARHTTRFEFDASSGRVSQTLHDPDCDDEWRLIGAVDLDASRAENRLVAALTDIVCLGD
jgi:hypothetical protein